MNYYQIPNLAVIVGAIVFLLDIYGIKVESNQVQGVVEAIIVLVIAFSAGWNWIHTHFLVKENLALKAAMSVGSAKPKKKKK
jgi:uncharacterized protein (DUF697 family)